MKTQVIDNKRQAIIWGRFSSDKQSDGDSRERQERLNRALAKREGIQVHKEYFDEGVSVKDGATPLFKKVIDSLPEGVGIITENLDRINRGHPWRAKAFIADILETGHFIITSQDGREYTADSISQLETLLLGDMATNVAYAENSKRIKRVREAKAQAVELARKGIPSPLGAWLPPHLKYNFDTKRYDIRHDRLAIVQRIFKEYASGKGVTSICKGLNVDRIPTFRGKRIGDWTKTTIFTLLRYEGLIGVLTL
jgi:DNA invertase Pin-like site-specific DNA recombinase